MGKQDDILHKKMEYAKMFSFYSPLLTEKQREIVRLYCEEDLSLSEIALQAGISKQATADAISRSFSRFDALEKKLALVQKFCDLSMDLQSLASVLERLKAKVGNCHEIDDIQRIIQMILTKEGE